MSYDTILLWGGNECCGEVMWRVVKVCGVWESYVISVGKY